MEIIEFTTVKPEWVGTLGIVLGSILAVAIVVAIVVSIVQRDGLIWVLPGVIAFFSALVYIPIAGDTDGVLTNEERQRVASEVSEVVGFEVSEGEVDLMLDEKPVRDVYYIRDGNTLVVEER